MHTHFIGIGGIGVSALARHLHAQGHTVSGTDLTHSELIASLAAEGVAITLGAHKKSSVPKSAERVIFTAAIKDDNPELREAATRGIPRISYAEAVGALTREHKTITVSGSHGKSTTTALVALALLEGYADPTVIVGTTLAEFGGSNYHCGRSPYFVLEADEWNKSFLNYSPHIAVITNIDAEHLDTYGTTKEVERTFREYVKKVPADGAIVANADDPGVRRVLKNLKRRIVWYSLSDSEARIIRRILHIPGSHNVSNALAALKCARLIGVLDAPALRAIANFRGTWRRFEFTGMRHGAFVYSDYGHHPSEIVATLKAARERFPFRRVWCAYQPHQYQRLVHHWDDFAQSFDNADRVLLLPVYAVAGREEKAISRKVNSAILTKELSLRGKHAHYAPSFADALYYLNSEVRKGDVVLIMGAGSIYQLGTQFVARDPLFAN